MVNIVVAGGGTAGHIEPALAVADALREQGANVTALGTERGLETDLIPKRGYKLDLIDPVPVPRKLNVDLILLPFRVLKAVHQTRNILKAAKADALIGFGGYVSAPAYVAARTLGLPYFVHEANARAGLANKLGVWLGGTGLNAVPGSGMRGDVVGVPIRANLSGTQSEETRQEGYQAWGLDPNKPTLLVTGGSQGARSLNLALADACEAITTAGIQILHAYGKKNEAPPVHPGYVAVPYIDRMDLAYAISDLVVCRAGAMTVAEVTAAGLPAIYVPLPHGNGEQALNAQSVISAGAATLIYDSDLTAQGLATQVKAILGDPEIHDSMVDAARRSGLGHAAEEIARRILNSQKS
ncbi:undecaprenyldiphospho-muramoylpentapeptide beta-N-acetylglucosaminyltransferase [Corynebacterium freiburgense]|uniref:undecaprenyldiphospho-muramoylpentapeptide beta-N-acetylglucosaminyltransferase n=1 Tax=Corynebacterium freiburgense TaxID=556548 RepID=UPI00040F1E12|nr:UDP-N-acetylglucosamine--N-acetylmuramyl-(pentapeptide) pyrophosphoryl-undecaprenol N-acetylglucosamine transferase [Corynebacterium freiburgense]